MLADLRPGGSVAVFADNVFRVAGSADATKKLAFEVDGFTTATTRTVTVPNEDGTMVMLATVQTLTNKTLTAPTINGTVATTGLTMPAFTAGGVITVGTGLGAVTQLLGPSDQNLLIYAGGTTRSLALGTNSTTNLTIDTSGRVGIGVSPETSMVLTLSGAPSNAVLYITSTGTGGTKIWFDENGVKSWTMGQDNGSANFSFREDTISGTERMKLYGNGSGDSAYFNGSVGIGQDGPAAMLHIISTSTTEPTLKIGTTPGGAAAIDVINVTMGANSTGSLINATLNGTSNRGIDIGTATTGAYTVNHILSQRSGTWSGGGNENEHWIAQWYHPTVTASATRSGSLIYGLHAPIASGASTTLTLSGSIFKIDHLPTVTASGTITDTTTGLSITMTPAAAAATRCAHFTAGANQTGNALRLDVRGTIADGVLRITHGASTTLSGYHGGVVIDLGGNVSGSQQIEALYIDVAAGAANTSNCANFFYRATAGTAAGNGIINIGTDASTALTGQLVGIECDLSANITPGANAIIGQRILIPATTRANTAGEGALVISSDATAARALDIDIANVGPGFGAPACVVRWGGATTLTGAMDTVLIDALTNITHGGQTIRGLVIQIAATTAAAGNGQAGFFVDSRATAQNVADFCGLNTSGTMVGVRFQNTTTPNAVTLCKLDLQTSVTSNANANIGLDIPIVAADEGTTAVFRLNTMRVFVITGAPNNANGTDGDMTWRINGIATTSIYKKIAGVWTGIA